MKSFMLSRLLAFISCVTLTVTSVTAEAKTNALPRDCNDILVRARHNRDNATSGIYTIYPTMMNASGAQVFCEMDTSEGGWIVIQRRRETDGEQMNFFRNWTDYVDGFGSLHDSHWLGLEIISTLTSTERYKLRIDMTDWEGEERFADYAFFQVSDSSDNYRLTVVGYAGNAGDSFTRHGNMQFSTKDRDNDPSTSHCAQKYKGAWWYLDGCHLSNLNGVYGSLVHGEGINWSTWHSFKYSLKRVEMKIQRIN